MIFIMSFALNKNLLRKLDSQENWKLLKRMIMALHTLLSNVKKGE